MSVARKPNNLAKHLLEDILFDILDNTPIPMLFVDRDRRVWKANHAASEFAGRQAAELVGHSCGDALGCIHSMDDLKGCGFGPFCKECPVHSEVVKAFKNGDNYNRVEANLTLAHRGKIEDGALLISASCFDVSKNRMVLLCFDDITKHKQAEETLQKSGELYRDLLESMRDLVQSVRPDGSFVYVNPAWRKTLGYSEEEVHRLNLFDIIHPDSREHCEKVFAQVISGEEVGNVEVKFVRKDGTTIVVEGNANCRFKDGKPVTTRGIFRDITERKQVQEALKESEEKFRAIFENATDGILLADIETKKFHMGNKTISRMLGYSQEEIRNLGVADIHPEEKLSYIIGEFEKQVRDEGTLAKDMPVKRKDGSVFYADINSAPITLAGKTYLLGIFRDITEHKKAQETTRMLKAEKMVVEKLKKLDRMKNEFVETVTHELRTPMTPLRSAVEMFLDGSLGKLPPRQKEFLEMMGRNIERLSRYATDILSLSRLESGKYALHPSQVSLLSVVQPVVELLESRAQERNSSITLDVHSEMSVFADPDAVSQVVTNLVNNALAHTPKGTSVLVFSRLTNMDFVEVFVADDGPGIPADAIDKIFDKFYQINRESGPGYKGTGVGLAICKALVEGMNGIISVESQLGKGTVFRFTLPGRRPS